MSADEGVVDLENDIKLALLRLPNQVIDGVTVKAALIETDADNIHSSLTHANGVITGKLALSASTITEVVVVEGHINAGQYVVGPGINYGTQVLSSTGTTITLSQPVAGNGANPARYRLVGSVYDTGSDAQKQGLFPGPRGAYVDFSQQIPSGEDTPVLNVFEGSRLSNHGRRLPELEPPIKYSFLTIKIRFTGSSVQGPQHLLVVEDYLCEAGCTPMLTGLPLETRKTSEVWSTIVEVTKSDFNSFECGRRGKCDYTTGLCQCFAGYIGDNCNTLTTLV
jgi:hypothetical protein